MEDEKLWLVVGDKEGVQQTLHLGQMVVGSYQTLHYSTETVQLVVARLQVLRIVKELHVQQTNV